MFDISWTEFVLIGVVALIVIGPKELPAVMRTMGQWTRKIRSMAAEFQNQFQEAMREAEMADLKKQVDDVARDIKQYDPLKEVRTEVENIGKDIEGGAVPSPAAELPVREAATELQDKNIVGAGTGPVVPETATPAPAAPPTEPAPPASEQREDAMAVATGPVAPETADSAAPRETTERTG